MGAGGCNLFQAGGVKWGEGGGVGGWGVVVQSAG